MNSKNKNLQKQIRDNKRQSLAKILEGYELKIEENESLYQEELLRLFENNKLLSQQPNNQIENLRNCLNNYLQHRIDMDIRKIRYKETIFRRKLNHPRHRYSHQPPSSLITNKATNVYPEVIIEMSETDQQQQQQPFTEKELALLSSAGILLCLCLNIKLFF
jgi:hypothetical protein